jgi:sialate O-acetylesterase
VGEVWLCSGQLNMEWSLAASAGADAEIARPVNPHLRQFLVKRSGPAKPLDECEGRWMVAGPETVAKFSGVAYYFGQYVARGTGRAVGVINASAGGTPIESWMSAEAIAQDAGWQAGVAAAERAEREYPERLKQHVAAVEAWLAKYERHDRPPVDVTEFVGPAARGEGWRTTEIVEALNRTGLPDGGAIWLRKKVVVPRVESVGLERGFQLSLGVMRGADTVYWNGRKIGGTEISAPGAMALRRYQVPPELLEREREATLAIRLFYPNGGPSLTVPNDPPLVANSVPIDGTWEVRIEFALDPLRDVKIAAFPTPPGRARAGPSRAFNGMIAPLASYGLRGAIWYQGESNVARAEHYPNSFALMVNDWRARWGRGDFPVYFCQLPNYSAKVAEPQESGWAAFREQQTRCLAVPATAVAVTLAAWMQFSFRS